MDHEKTRAKLLELRSELASRHERIDKHIHYREERRSDDSEERAG